MITEKRFENKRNNDYECYYRWNGKEIAWYNSKEDVVYLKDSMLSGNYKKSYFERMKESKFPEAFKELVEFLSIDENTKLSEYM